MAKTTDKMRFSEMLKLYRRALGDVHRITPGLLSAAVLGAILPALTPYVTIFLSAQIIGELSGLRRADVLWGWVAAAVIAAAVLSLGGAALTRWRNAKMDMFISRSLDVYTDKTLSLDFADVDDPAVRDRRRTIDEAYGYWARGFSRVIPEMLEKFVGSAVGVVSAVSLTVSLFTETVPAGAGAFTALNNPLFSAVVMLAVIGVTVAASACRTKSSALFAGIDESTRFGNRLFSVFGFFAHGSARAMDFRMYDQHIMAEHYMQYRSTFGVGSVYDKLARGPFGLLAAVYGALSAVLSGAVYLFVCLKAWAGAFGVGEVTQYVGAVTALSANLTSLLEVFGEMRTNAPFLQKSYDYLDIPNAMYQGSLTTEKRSDRQYEVEFRNVSFKYPGTDVWALRNVSLKFRVGSRLAIVGENGSGKTTFIKLLCRLYDPQEGEILLNGIDIRKYNYRDYMGVFAVVFQDFRLLSQPLGDNVAGSADYDRERATRALTDAGFAERLASMPRGLDTLLYRDFGDGGVEVSGGEAQKIAIARALYKDAPFIILDEPTAALDPIAEAEIYSKFNDIAGDRTAVYISHRLSSCKFCDEILVFDGGRIVQQGAHDALLGDEAGKYAELWHAQAQYYENE